ncbi:Putative Holin-like Toxin (Hol-Tox) [Pilibacter termitis]|uniref:Putative Holin-like Toxin (Hol-Tox) n=1 Tax=Pilibacter termitis TaxID=263852 RepID=A0A1T4MZA6_9ENTE|nr:Putative Holin-like Toxin (Hol-Tox) [Pilibacter termitis]
MGEISNTQNLQKGKAHTMTVYETLQLMLAFGAFVVALLSLVVVLVKKDNYK